jgi:hypothetical protein
MYTNIIEQLAATAGARGLKDRFGRQLFAVVAPVDSPLYAEVQAVDSAYAFSNFNDALAALPKGGQDINAQIPNTIYVSGRHQITNAGVRFIIPVNLSGLTVYCEKESAFETVVDLGSMNNAVIAIEGRDVKLTGYPKIENTFGTQTGTGLAIGGRFSDLGDGRRAYVENLVINGSETTNDFQRCLSVRGGIDVTLKDCILHGGTGTTGGVLVVQQAGDGVAFTRNGNRVRLINCRALVNGDSGNACIPLHIMDNTTPNGIISGGSFFTDGSGRAAVITSDNWVLDDGVSFGSRGSLTSGGVVDLVTATKINIGVAYYKKVDANTAPVLIDQTNL